ncbi:sortase [Kitasatospora sp. NPDC085895]|uniref:sortase n=1 Tax=Kitasatospora sp. NPDC085895 TaxID=3155057 RepID=UPI00344CA7CD
MHISRVVTGSAALALGALALAVPSAAAEDSGFTISPRSASPGQTVTISTTACGPDVTYGKAFSDLTDQINLLAGDQKGTLVGTFQVPEDAAPGDSGITVKCPPRIQMTGTLTIIPRPSGAAAAGSGGAAGNDPRPSGAAAAGSGGAAGNDPRPSGAAAAGSGGAAGNDPRPSGAVAAGSGGAADADGSQVALGTVLLAGAVAGGAVKIRRRFGAARV